MGVDQSANGHFHAANYSKRFSDYQWMSGDTLLADHDEQITGFVAEANAAE